MHKHSPLRRFQRRQTVVIQLSSKLEEKIAALVSSGHYSDADEVVDAAVQLLEDQELKTNPA
jgi:putative addiction module CopG family antidote